MAAVDSTAFFRPHWLCWQVLGAVPEGVRNLRLYIGYSIILNILVTFCYPLHLALSLFTNATQADDMKNLAVTVTCLACSAKFLLYASKLKQVREFERLLSKLDASVKTEIELNYFKVISKQMRQIAYIFLSVYLPIGITAELSFIYREERSLLYPAWFPLDWQVSTWKFYVANVYQIVGIFYMLLQNYVDDCFPTMALCVLSGHIKLLGLRAAQLGYDSDNQLKNEIALDNCIKDQQHLYKLFDTIQDIISQPIFIQFCVTAVNICVAMAALLFYVEAPLDRLYYFVYFLSMPLEIFPTCYYGSYFQQLLGQLQYDIFCSNWVGQSRKYKKHMLLFSERAMKQTNALAGGMVRIHLDTFFASCKGAYSLFAVIMKMKS